MVFVCFQLLSRQKLKYMGNAQSLNYDTQENIMFATDTTTNVQSTSIEIDGKALDSSIETSTLTTMKFTDLNFVGGGSVTLW
jgi:hypothetical protein